ncbi:sigma-70 family RNA polymerase sigma factor [Clostridium tertium]|jgi:RNA polymerase primary sigma factor|uniref:sigma-70 family RNA polymerase sigma factor n=1 Tax=Clostridium tertium TaxID=1559 RepID=UPI00232F7946|nr:sigma-70 family RNA polymerase sigma factor [Clostridium tertium]MDB1956607.1 sigma-70 family RNA polymerase sigma factor [Clostridium tertium]MDB1958478.1 sigma-70 family RNA polymerase sigma factor [Clostridium tertium]MDB1962369.1 sigma-70 family RNA polymerase sigma factor [Clostridium tertium]MDB1967659.1 sigma-70 family RNA polymerase sigma factor [Clostridium tertium]
MNNEELVQLYQNGDNKALEKLIQANTGIIKKIAIKYNGINRELEFDDLFQNGVLGLIAAAKKYKFDIEKKAKFITYAVFYIDRYIHRSVNGGSSKDIGNNKLYSSCTSLNITTGEEGETRELGEFIEDIEYGYDNIEEKLFIANLRKELENLMQTHNTLEQREILKFKYGWNTTPMKLDDIANIFGITINKVNNIEHMALRKLRNSSWAINHIKEFAELGYIDKFYLDIFREWGIEV